MKETSINVHALTRTLCALLLLALPFAAAQTLIFSVNAGAEGLEPDVRAEGIRAGGLTFGVRAAGGLEPLTGEAGVNVRFNTSLGPLGNVSVLGAADADTAGAFAVSVNGSGVLGPVGARARLAAFNVNPGSFAPDAIFEDARPFLLGASAEPAFALQAGLGVTYRLNRTTIATLDPDLLYLSGSGFGVRAVGTVELRRLRGRDNGIVLAEGYLAPGGDAGHGALGFTYARNVRGAPTLRGSVLLGAGSDGLWPGARLTLQSSGRARRAPVYSLTLAAEPYRTDTPQFRADASVAGDLGPGELRTSLLAVPTEDFGAPLFTLRSAYRITLK